MRALLLSVAIKSVTFVSEASAACPYDSNCLNNPYGAGSPYKSNGLMNPYSQYGSPYSNKSWNNPYATDAPKLYDSNGNYRGRLSTNKYDPDSVSNPYGRWSLWQPLLVRKYQQPLRRRKSVQQHEDLRSSLTLVK